MIKITIIFDDDGDQTSFEVNKEDEGKITMTESVFAMVTMYKIKEANEILQELAEAQSQEEFDKTLKKYGIEP